MAEYRLGRLYVFTFNRASSGGDDEREIETIKWRVAMKGIEKQRMKANCKWFV